MTDPIRPVARVLAPPPPHMVGDGFRVHNFFPMGYPLGRARMSPFFLSTTARAGTSRPATSRAAWGRIRIAASRR